MQGGGEKLERPPTFADGRDLKIKSAFIGRSEGTTLPPASFYSVPIADFGRADQPHQLPSFAGDR